MPPERRAPARIAIDYTSAVRQGGGIGRYTRELVRALVAQDPHNRYTLFVADPRPSPAGLAPNARFRRVPVADVWLQRLWHRLRLPLPVEWFTGDFDLFHQPDFVLPPLRRGVPGLLTVHDLTFVRDPDSAAPNLRRYLNRVVPESVARAAHVLADSAATREDLVREYGTAPEKITVLYPGVDARFAPQDDPAEAARVRERYKIADGPFVLSVGTIQPRKNHVRLIQAFAAAVGAKHPPAPARSCSGDSLVDASPLLVIAGGRGWMYDEIYAEVERQGLAGRVHFPGFVDDGDLPALYRAADVFAYPALYEGFGLPVLEALACGTPVVTSNVSSLPEVAGDAALQVEPTDVDALSAALMRLLTDQALRAGLRERGLAQARRFTWEGAARQLLEIYRRIVDREQRAGNALDAA